MLFARRSIQRHLLYAALILAISIGGVISAELTLRLLFPEKVIIATQQFNPDYLYALKPNIKANFERESDNGGEIIPWETNAESFRGNELRTNSDMRLLVYGDSNIQAIFSHLRNTFAFKLESYLKSLSNRDVEVINSGVVGFGPDQNLIRLSLDVDKLAPDFVLFHVFADNDFGDLLRNKLIDLKDETIVRRPSHSPIGTHRLQEFASSFLIVRAAQKLFTTIYDAVFPQDENSYVNELLYMAANEYTVYLSHNEPALTVDHYDIDVALYPHSPSAQLKISLMKAVLAEAQRLLQSRGIPLFILIQPSVIDMTTNFSPLDYEYLRNYPSYRQDRLTSIVESICTQLEIPNLNLYSLFKQNNPSTLFFHGHDAHWNDAGQDLAAHEVAQRIHALFPTFHQSEAH